MAGCGIYLFSESAHTCPGQKTSTSGQTEPLAAARLLNGTSVGWRTLDPRFELKRAENVGSTLTKKNAHMAQMAGTHTSQAYVKDRLHRVRSLASSPRKIAASLLRGMVREAIPIVVCAHPAAQTGGAKHRDCRRKRSSVVTKRDKKLSHLVSLSPRWTFNVTPHLTKSEMDI